MSRLGCSQANVLGHLACLKDCGLVADRPHGRVVYYRVAHPEIIDLLHAGEELLARSEWATCSLRSHVRGYS